MKENGFKQLYHDFAIQVKLRPSMEEDNKRVLLKKLPKNFGKVLEEYMTSEKHQSETKKILLEVLEKVANEKKKKKIEGVRKFEEEGNGKMSGLHLGGFYWGADQRIKSYNSQKRRANQDELNNYKNILRNGVDRILGYGGAGGGA